MVLTKRRYTFDEWVDSPANTTLSELVDGIPVARLRSGDVLTSPLFPTITLPVADLFRALDR